MKHSDVHNPVSDQPEATQAPRGVLPPLHTAPQRQNPSGLARTRVKYDRATSSDSSPSMAPSMGGVGDIRGSALGDGTGVAHGEPTSSPGPCGPSS